MEIDPLTLAARDRYKLLIGAIVPRPIAFVSTVSPDGAPNLAPFSFFNGLGGDPMSLLFCPSNNDRGEDKDTLRNVEATGQFVVNIVSEGVAQRMVACAEELPYGESEFDLSGLTPAPSRRVRPARVAESPLCFECEKTHVIRLHPGAPGAGNCVIGRVVWVHAQEGVIDAAWHVNPARLAAVGRMAGLTYCTTRKRFDIPWGRKALEAEVRIPE